MNAFIAGPNFSGRSAALMTRLRAAAPAFFIGPYAEAALSGLSNTVADEIAIYRAPQPARAPFTPLDFAAYAARKPPTLSGGEQVLLALALLLALGLRGDRHRHRTRTARSGEPRMRRSVYLSRERHLQRVLVDNRLDQLGPAGLARQMPGDPASAAACDLAAATRHLARAPRRTSRSSSSPSAIPAAATSSAISISRLSRASRIA